MKLPVLKKAIGAGLLVVCILGLVWGLLYLRHTELSRRHFVSQLSSAVQGISEEPGSTFKMTSLTDFAWDGLYIFGPYTPADEVEKSLGFSWPPVETTQMQVSDAFCLFVFTHKNKVVLYFDYPRGRGDFANLGTTRITPDAAEFSVERDKGGWLVVTLKDLSLSGVMVPCFRSRKHACMFRSVV